MAATPMIWFTVFLACSCYCVLGKPLKPDGSHVCSYMEGRQVQRNVSYITSKLVSVRRKYVTKWWTRSSTRYRTIYRMQSAVKYMMKTVWENFPVYYCCSGWMQSEGREECSTPICAVDCMNGGKCVAPDKCECQSGFEGEFCQNDVNECKDESKNNCEQVCENTWGSFRCRCKRGFEAHPEETNKCIDTDECSRNPCKCAEDSGNCTAICVNSAGSYRCRCSKGYTLKYDTCHDINECIDGVCQHHCINLPGGYVCKCLDGFELDANSSRCEDIDECKIQNGGCNHKCHNVYGGYVCSCKDGHYLGADRRTCKAIKPDVKVSLVCADQTDNFVYISCNWPTKIKVMSAFYGRVASDVCMYKNFTTEKACSYDGITELIAKKCDGRTTCFLGATEQDYPELKDPCPDLSKYLKVSAQCQFR